MNAQTEPGTIERQIRIDASPDVVYEVVSRPEHLVRWWVDEADFTPEPGATGTLAWGMGRADAAPARVPIAVVEAVPGVRFSFRWTAPPAPASGPDAGPLTAADSLLVTFDLAPDGTGTLLTVTETSLREVGWEAAVLEAYYRAHEPVWPGLLERLRSYADGLATGGSRG